MVGALPKLKKKIELNYRKGSTCESKNCQYCICAALVYLPTCDWRKVVYWSAAAVLTCAVTY